MGSVGTHKKININAAGEAMYLVTVVLYVLEAFSYTTLFCISWPADYDNMLRMLLCVSIFLKFCNTREHAQAGTEKKWLVCILSVLLFKFSWISTGYTFLLDTALLIVGAAGIPYRKIIKAGFWVEFYALLITMLGSFAGCITDLVYSSNGQFRHSFGIVYPTDFAAHVVFLALSGWVLYGGGSAFFAFCAAGLAAFTEYFCRAKCSTVVLCLFTVAVMYNFLTEKNRQKHTVVNAVAKGIGCILPYIMPVCAALIIMLTLLYAPENELITQINTLLSNRLKLGWSAIDTYGIKLFGTTFEQIGFGGGTAWTWSYAYNFIDSSYILVLVRYGLMVLLAICAQDILMMEKAVKNGQRRVALAVALVAIHSMIEHHLPEAAYNLFLLLPFADFQCSQKATEKKPAYLNRVSCALGIAALAGGIVAVMFFPRAVGYLKTVADVLHLGDQANHIYFIGIAAALLAAAHWLIWMTSKAIALSIKGKKTAKIVCAELCILSLAPLCIALLAEPVISQGQEECNSLIETDRLVIEALLSDKGLAGKLYVDYMPEAYKRQFSGLSCMVLAAEGLAYKKDTTLITEDLAELEALIDAGYEYGEISDQHAVYTNSPTAKGILEKTGINLTSYYSRQRTVDLADMALRNNLGMAENQTLLLSGLGKSLTHGLGVTIYKGVLRVEYEIHLVSSTIGEGTIATAKITSDWGVRTWGTKDVSLSDFDEKGKCTIVLDANLRLSCPNMEFLLLVQDGVELEVREIRYGKVE